MTIENFNKLSETEKVKLIFDADKITEKADNEANYQLFQIDEIFVEAKTSLYGKFKRFFTAYSMKDLPVEYASELMSIPVVALKKQSHAGNLERPVLQQKENLYKRAM